MTNTRHSHQTTLRFSESLWQQLADAADLRGVSVAQYVRDAARAQLLQEAATAGAPPSRSARLRHDAAEVREQSLGEKESSAALREQGRLARERAQLLRDRGRERRVGRPAS